jgi:uridine phosphorylase
MQPGAGHSELILRDKRVYHLNLSADDIAPTVILVGDPGRVEQVSACFSSIEFKTSHREFITHTGILNGKPITVMSTGIGTDNIDIVLNELDAAVNIDPETRKPREKLRRLDIIRLGTSGSLQEDIRVDNLVVSSHGLGIDCLLNYYSGCSNINSNDISQHFMSHCSWNDKLPYPFCIRADQELLGSFESDDTYKSGITITAPGFYAPQGRSLRLDPEYPTLNASFTSFRYNGMRIANYEMETSALYGLGSLLGHRCLTVCVIIANRLTGEFCKNYSKSVEQLIERTLNKVTDLYI